MTGRATLPVFLAALLAGGCGGSERIARENDLLREEKAALQQDVERLQDQVRQLAARVEQLEAAPAEIPPEVLAATPRLARISIGRLSHTSDEDGDGRPDLLRVYINPEDDRGRFVQIVGTLSVHAAVLPPDADAVTIGRVTLGPADVREAYRSTVLGIHYTLTVPLDLGAVPETPRDCSVRIHFHDGRSGVDHHAERSVAL